MPDERITENLDDILESIELIQTRFSKINKPDDFVLNSDGVLLLDSISMRLQMVGELLKKVSKMDKGVLEEYPEIEWANIMKMPDLISHHYNQIDHEIIYDICENNLSDLKRVIKDILGKS